MRKFIYAHARYQYSPSLSCFLTILTILLVPSLDAPSSTNFSASSIEDIPPAAFILTFLPTCFAKSSMSANVAPAFEKPVEVLMKSAPALVTSSHILIFSSSVRRQVSMMTLRILVLTIMRLNH